MSTPARGYVETRQGRKILLRYKRKLEENQEDVSYLNITAMMDMMTILLVFLLKSWSVSSGVVERDVAPPESSARLAAADSLKVVLTSTAVLVDGQQVVPIRGGTIDPSYKQEGANGFLITPLHQLLAQHATREKKLAAIRGEEFAGELALVADKKTPYRLLTEVLYTAGQAEFRNYRLVTVQAGQ